MLNKKADDRYLTWWNVLMWVITGAAILVLISFFYSVRIDVRENEATLLGSKIIDCMTDSGKYNQDFNSDNFNIFKECDLDRSTLWKGNYFFHVSVFKGGELIKENMTGTFKYEKECALKQDMKEGDYPGCFYKELTTSDGISQITIKIFAASNQLGAKI